LPNLYPDPALPASRVWSVLVPGAPADPGALVRQQARHPGASFRAAGRGGLHHRNRTYAPRRAEPC